MMPITIRGYRFTTCHVLPATVSLVLSFLVLAPLFAVVSHFITPVQLESIWMDKREFTAAQVAAGEAKYVLSKSGPGWRRTGCAIDAKQTFIDEKGTTRIAGEIHAVEVPSELGRLTAKPRRAPDVMPKILATAPGWWRLQLVNVNGACWPWERVWPIAATTPVEAWFRIVAE